MALQVRVTFRNVKPSRAVETRIQREAEKLLAVYSGLQGCDATVEAPHRHRRRGYPFQVRLVLAVPGEDIVINRTPLRVEAARDLDPEDGAAALPVPVSDKDVYGLVKDAFDAARRRLSLHARREHRMPQRREPERRRPAAGRKRAAAVPA